MTSARLLEAFSQADPTGWDAVANPMGGVPQDPFTTHRFLMALESSGSTGPGTGWEARPLVLADQTALQAALPLYVKSHSQGEYIFDHGWAEAYQNAGGRYYPKLQVAVPFTPVPGPRFLGPDDQRPALLDAAIGLAQGNGLSSLHITFCTGEEAAALEGHKGTLARLTQQYHWQNHAYRDFDDFLSTLSSRKRKMIRREREIAQGHGLRIEVLAGDALGPAHIAAMWGFYQDTGARKWGRPYLTRAFFEALLGPLRRDALLILALEGDRPVAGALNFIGRDALFGRYWGTNADYPCLHFELCYYQAMDWAIAHGLSRVEAGAQGEHKIARGYLPQPIHSLHWIADPGLRSAVARYLEGERRAVGEEIEVLTAYGPFRRGNLQERD